MAKPEAPKRKVMGKSQPEKGFPSRFDNIDMKGENTTTEPKIPETNPTEIVCILDRSWSMDSIKSAAIEGFNGFLADQKSQPGEATMTIVLFDDKYELLTSGTPIQEVEPLNATTYVPRGSTALNDAIGRTITELEKRNPKNAIISILTDGQENVSTQYQKQQIKDMLKNCSDKGWFVAYLSASIDAFADAKSYGVSMSQTSSFRADPVGIRTATLGASYATSSYRSMGAVGMSMGRMSSMPQYMAQASNNLNMSDINSPSNTSSTTEKKHRWRTKSATKLSVFK